MDQAPLDHKDFLVRNLSLAQLPERPRSILVVDDNERAGSHVSALVDSANRRYGDLIPAISTFRRVDHVRSVAEAQGYLQAILATEAVLPSLVLDLQLEGNERGIDLIGYLISRQVQLPIGVFSGMHASHLQRSFIPGFTKTDGFLLGMPLGFTEKTWDVSRDTRLILQLLYAESILEQQTARYREACKAILRAESEGIGPLPGTSPKLHKLHRVQKDGARFVSDIKAELAAVMIEFRTVCINEPRLAADNQDSQLAAADLEKRIFAPRKKYDTNILRRQYDIGEITELHKPMDFATYVDRTILPFHQGIGIEPDQVGSRRIIPRDTLRDLHPTARREESSDIGHFLGHVDTFFLEIVETLHTYGSRTPLDDGLTTHIETLLKPHQEKAKKLKREVFCLWDELGQLLLEIHGAKYVKMKTLRKLERQADYFRINDFSFNSRALAQCHMRLPLGTFKEILTSARRTLECDQDDKFDRIHVEYFEPLECEFQDLLQNALIVGDLNTDAKRAGVILEGKRDQPFSIEELQGTIATAKPWRRMTEAIVRSPGATTTLIFSNGKKGNTPCIGVLIPILQLRDIID